MIAQEPCISVGLVENADPITFELQGPFLLGSLTLPPGTYQGTCSADALVLTNAQDDELARNSKLRLIPGDPAVSRFTIRDIAIGRQFHWERLQNQQFRGELLLDRCDGPGLTAINCIGLESYLESVICSEMSPESDGEFLKAHCVISRSWLLAQLELKSAAQDAAVTAGSAWTDAAAHRFFDVCNDDHCQRYHGLARVNRAAQEALAATRGTVLMHDGRICDTRFSKCCGGITERFSTCWQDADFAYLQPVADAAPEAGGLGPPVNSEADARAFILSSPEAFCNVTDAKLLSRVLPDFDFETQRFFRWSVSFTQQELQRLLLQKTGIDFGAIQSMTALARGDSGRIIQLEITGTKTRQVIAKELAIRRALSPTHLYSSAFIVEASGQTGRAPERFILHGAGWGHGVGLCQIGAAAMAGRGYGYEAILAHYFRGARLESLYA